MSDINNDFPIGLTNVAYPKYKCKKHGIFEDDAVIISKMPGFEGIFCMRCWVEWMEKNLCQVELVKEKKEQ